MSRITEIDIVNLGIPSPGSLLKARRQEYGWSIQDVARALRLSERQIEAIEEDDYDNLPGKTYVMGYWRSYSQLLQIQIEDSVQVHRAELSGGARDNLLEPGHRGSHGSDERSRQRVALLFAGLLLVVLGAIWFWQHPEISIGKWINIGIDNFSNKELPESMVPVVEDQQQLANESATKSLTAQQTESVLALPVPNFAGDQETVEINTRGYEVSIADLPLSRPNLIYQLKEEPEADSEAAALESGQTGESGDTSANSQNSVNNATSVAQSSSTTQQIKVETIEVQPSQQQSTTASESGDRKIVFKVEKESWIDVRDATGERLIYRTVNRGEDIRLQGQPPYSVFIGSAEGVTVQYQGREVPFKAHESGLFARFEVGN
ncbi:MAG: RodZ domain-containing protein [Arenicellales bacterium]